MPKSAASHSIVAVTLALVRVTVPASLAAAGPASTPAPRTASAPARAARLGRRTRAIRRRSLRRRGLLLGAGRLEALLRPRLVELDAPLALLVLHEGQARAERAAAAALEAGHRL